MQEKSNGNLHGKGFAFDLDGTVTCEETLPVLAWELGLAEEMALLTRLTMEGKLPFRQSFRLRYYVLRNLPMERIHRVMDQIPLEPAIVQFIREHADSCAIVTGNLELWIEPILRKLGCRCFSSSERQGNVPGLPEIQFVDKRAAVRTLKQEFNQVIAIGDGFNDIPMLEEADVAVVYGGVHPPSEGVLSVADYVARNGEELCGILRKQI